MKEINIINKTMELEFNDIENTPSKNYGGEDSRSELVNSIGNSSKEFKGLCIKCNADGDLTILYGTTECLMPKNEVTIENDTDIHIGLCNRKVGSYVKFKVKEVTDNNIIITRKDYIKKIRDNYNKILKEGSIVNGKVVRIDETRGVFVDIGADCVGVIPRKFLENIYVSTLANHITEGEMVTVVITDIKRNEDGSIRTFGLNRKVLLPQFEELAANYKIGDVIIANVKAINATGIYCSLDKHLDILCDFSNTLTVSPNDKVVVKINKIRTDKKRISGIIISKV